MGIDSAPDWSRERIERFLAEEDLRDLKIRLPHGLAIPGEERELTLRRAFGDDLAGQSVLDTGSRLGYFCLAARERGAGRVVGWETDADLRRRAGAVAEMKGLDVEYEGIDVETGPDGERFDVVLCLNVLHDMRDPIGVLDKLIRMTRQTLVLEVAAFDDRKTFGRIATRMMAGAPLLLVEPADTSGRNSRRRFLMTRSALGNLLVHQRNAFARVDIVDSEVKGRFLVVARKRRVDDLVVVAGPTSSGKSTLIEELRSGQHPELARRLGHESLAGWTLLGASKLGRDATEHFPQLIFHYDFLRPLWRSARTHHRDEALDLLQGARRVGVVTVDAAPERLRAQLQSGELEGSKPGDRHLRIARLYERDGTIRALYDQWYDFVDGLSGRIDGRVTERLTVSRVGEFETGLWIRDQDDARRSPG